MSHQVKKTKYGIREFTREDFPLAVNRQYSQDHVLHTHDFTELVVVESGKSTHILEDSEYLIVKGDVLVIPRGVKHGYRNSEKFRLTNLLFDLSLIASWREDFEKIPGFCSLFTIDSEWRKKLLSRKGFLSLDSYEISYVKKLVDRIESEQNEKRNGYKVVCTLSLADLITFLSRKASKHNWNDHAEKLSEVLCYMERKHTSKISLQKLSQIANMSPRNFQRIFKGYMGVTPSKHLLNIRMQSAKRLLKDTEASINEIAYAAGFNDCAYFAKQFKSMFFCSPSLYRKQSKEFG